MKIIMVSWWCLSVHGLVRAMWAKSKLATTIGCHSSSSSWTVELIRLAVSTINLLISA